MGIALHPHSSFAEVPYSSFFPLGLASPAPSVTSGSHDAESSLEATPLTIPTLAIEPRVEIASEFPTSYPPALGSYTTQIDPFAEGMEMLGLNQLAQTATDKMSSPLIDQHPNPEIMVNPVTSNQSPSWTMDVDRFIHRKSSMDFSFSFSSL
jgi:hypothetical protein